MRIALLGPPPEDIGGLPLRTLNTILGLADTGAQVEVFVNGTNPLPQRLRDHQGVVIHQFASRWEYDRWYSSNDGSKLLTGSIARVVGQRELVRGLVRRHAEAPFAILYRLSQIELFALRQHLPRLPPLVMHPGTHAQGELYWHWHERGLALRGEGRARFLANHAYLASRAVMQRRDMRQATRVIAPSKQFAGHLIEDYRVPACRIQAIPNPVDLATFAPAESSPAAGRVRLLFISRMSVRKGVEDIVALSHRLDDLAGGVHIECVGGASLFSDYRALLAELNPRTSIYRGRLPSAQLPELYRSGHVLLQPSHYEPFANTVSEALASGLPVVVSDKVGAGEGLDPEVCRRYPAGDVDRLELEVRTIVAEIEADGLSRLSVKARAEATRRFAIPVVAGSIAETLESAVR